MTKMGINRERVRNGVSFFRMFIDGRNKYDGLVFKNHYPEFVKLTDELLNLLDLYEAMVKKKGTAEFKKSATPDDELYNEGLKIFGPK